MRVLLFFVSGIIPLFVNCQKLEFRPNLLISPVNIAKIPAFGAQLECIYSIRDAHKISTGVELLYGEGNRNFKDIQEGLYSYRFDYPDVPGQVSAYTYLYPVVLKYKSSRLTQAAFHLRYKYSNKLGRHVMEFGAGAYLNYVSGFYVVDVVAGQPNYVYLGDPINFFVIHYFFNYLDIGPTISAHYIFQTKKSKIEPVFGIAFNYGTNGGSWLNTSIGFRIK